MSQGATELYVTSGAVLNVSDGAIEFRNMSRGNIPLSILTARRSGTSTGPLLLSSGTVPKLSHLATATGSIYSPVLSWAGGGSSGASGGAVWSVPVPIDWDTATGWSVNLYGDKTSGNEAAVFQVHITPNGTSTGNLGGNASAAPTTAQTAMACNVASGAGIVPGGVVNVGIEAQVNASATIRLHSAYIDYKRKN